MYQLHINYAVKEVCEKYLFTKIIHKKVMKSSNKNNALVSWKKDLFIIIYHYFLLKIHKKSVYLNHYSNVIILYFCHTVIF